MSLTGIFPALLTAYDDEGELSRQRTGALVSRLNEAGANGYFVSGSSAECYLLSTGERLSSLECVREFAEDRPLIFHVGASDHRDTLALAREAKEAGAAAICANIPTYFSYSDESLSAYYSSVRECTDLPLLAYYIPSQTGRTLSSEFFLRLAQDEVLQGLKYTDSNLSVLAGIIADQPDGFITLGGADDVLLAALAMGASGGIGSSYNLACALYVELFEAHQRGDLTAAREAQALANRMLRTMAGWEFIGYLKSACRLRGVELGEPRCPMSPITPHGLNELQQTLASISHLEHRLI